MNKSLLCLALLTAHIPFSQADSCRANLSGGYDVYYSDGKSSSSRANLSGGLDSQ